MLISALNNYYDVLAKNGKVLPEGYSDLDISCLIALNDDGSIADIIDCRISDPNVVKGKPFPKQMRFPKKVDVTKIDSNIIEHRGEYIFGLGFDNETKSIIANNITKFVNFREKNMHFIDSLNGDLVDAYRAFLETWNPDKEVNNPKMISLGKNIGLFKFAFCLAGRPDKLLQEEKVILKAWDKYYRLQKDDEDVFYAQCAITGEEAPIARIHNKISGLYGGKGTGNILVGFKEPAFVSYGATQSYNSNISQTAMEKYTEAMNYLIANPLHRTVIEGMTILHWAEDGNEKCSSVFSSLFELKDTADKEQTDRLLYSLIGKVKDGIATIDEETFNNMIDTNVKYYIVGLKPNATRISIKFMYCQRFGTIIENVLKHIQDMQMNQDMKAIPIWKIHKELISPKSNKENVDPALSTKLMQSIIMGTPYPTNLLATVVRRIKTDSDEEKNHYIKMNDVRMGIIKAYVNRNCRNKGIQEEIKMALDKSSRNPAYVCGRLFAVLENIQQRASGYSLNRTIRDSYFSTAASQPAVVFPKLISLSQHHLAKIDDYGYRDKEIQDLMVLLDTSFPKTLSLIEQGEFMLGYYQQKADTDKKIKEYKENNK